MFQNFWNVLALSKRLYDRKLQPVCDACGITRMELDILLFLANNPGFDTASDIVQRRRLTKSHVSISIKGLEQKGYLKRSMRQGNHKTIHLQILPAADAIIANGKRVQNEFSALLFSGFSSNEIKGMGARLERMAANLRAALPGGAKDAV